LAGEARRFLDRASDWSAHWADDSHESRRVIDPIGLVPMVKQMDG